MLITKKEYYTRRLEEAPLNALIVFACLVLSGALILLSQIMR